MKRTVSFQGSPLKGKARETDWVTLNRFAWELEYNQKPPLEFLGNHMDDALNDMWAVFRDHTGAMHCVKLF